MLRKYICFSLLILLLLGCQSSVNESHITLQPDWLLTPPREEGFFYGVGFHDQAVQAKERALINAAQQFSSQVRSSLEEWTIEKDDSSQSQLSIMEEQVTRQTLVGAKFVDQYQDISGKYWVLVKAPLDCMLDVTESLILSYHLDMRTQGDTTMELSDHDSLFQSSPAIDLIDNLQESMRTVSQEYHRREELVPEGFVFVEAGTFLMGSENHLEAMEQRDDQGNLINLDVSLLQHEVTLTRDFLIGRYEVTQEQWVRVMEDNPSTPRKRDDLSRYPVNKVSWYDAVQFCNEWSIQEGLEPAYTISRRDVQCDFNATGYRLPTEAEWEYAARGGQESLGYTFPGSNDSRDVFVGWTGFGIIREKGQLIPNELGIYDLCGNVGEWCWDRYSLSYYGESPAEDPTGPDSAGFRVIRSMISAPLKPKSSSRYGNRANMKVSSIGFRVVRTIP